MVRNAAHPDALEHELRPPGLDALPGSISRDRPGKYRVVPVHRPAVLRLEGPGSVPDHLHDPVAGQLPLRSFEAEPFGDRHRATEAVQDRGGAGEQGVPPEMTVGIHGPQHLTTRLLQTEGESRPRLRCSATTLRAGRGRPCTGSATRRRWRCTGPRSGPGGDPRCRLPGGSSTSSRPAAAFRASHSKARSASGRRPASTSAMADSVWFQGSAWPPGNQGIMPFGSWTETIHEAVSAISTAVSGPVMPASARRSRGSCRGSG